MQTELETVDSALSFVARVRELLEEVESPSGCPLKKSLSTPSQSRLGNTDLGVSLEAAIDRARHDFPQVQPQQTSGYLDIEQVVRALQSPSTMLDGRQDWWHVDAMLLGLRQALGQYRASLQDRRRKFRRQKS